MTARVYTFFTAVFFCISAAFPATNARLAVENIAKFLTDSKSVTIRYVPISDSQALQPQIICIMGDKFKLNSNEMAVWYDGKTQWTYLTDTKEVSITEPTPEELAGINPLLILGTLLQHYSAKNVPASDNDTGAVELVPNTNVEGQLPISKMRISYKKTDYSPKKITVEFNAGNSLELQVKSITKGINYPHSTFVFNKKQLPQADIIDLR